MDFRVLIELCESPDDPIAALIDRAGFNEDDLDWGTSQYCGTFALALYGLLHQKGVDAHLVFAIHDRADARPGNYAWRHVMVRVGQRYYDIEGRVEPEHAIENYVWGMGGKIVEVDEAEVVREVHAVEGSYCENHYRRWLEALTRAARF